ncbi:hypothetical protein N7462_000948 [Penicillium macrosclerotiorum]|uniref:uncharacterized protein n=1 Tax=Penicillium macrosclerotiorum TaxID=303699 RepID=UPI00254662E7|nr:uncharacterized protein N7462_000948 [Penicillium macrosclerotiorum]KAJ5698943.1 hypothetical protein N7462_000948 [Penicillium macrosclerotiorum]
MVTGMSDNQIQEIAAEPQETRNERLQMKTDLERLQGGKRALSIFSASGLEPNAPSLFDSFCPKQNTECISGPADGRAGASNKFFKCKCTQREASSSSLFGGVSAGYPTGNLNTTSSPVNSPLFGNPTSDTSAKPPSLFSKSAGSPFAVGTFAVGSTPNYAPFGATGFGKANASVEAGRSSPAPTGSLFRNHSTQSSTPNNSSTLFGSGVSGSFGRPTFNSANESADKNAPANKYPDTKNAFQ